MKRIILNSLLMLGLSISVYADHLDLPALSVTGIPGEARPFQLPGLPLSSPDSGEMIKQLPGANINRNGPLTSIVQYRGLFGDRVNLLIDGVKVGQAGPNRMDSPLSYLPAALVQDITLYRGIAPVSTGIETLGGTIRARSQSLGFGHSDAAETHGNVSTAYADNGSTRSAALIAAVMNPSHRLQLQGSLDRGKNLKAGKGTIRPSQQRRDTVGLTYGFKTAATELAMTVNHHDTGKTGTPALPMDIIFARGETYHFTLTHEVTNNAQFHLRAHVQDADHRMSNYDLRTRPVMVNMGNMPMMRHADTDIRASSIHMDYNLGNWLFGLDADKEKHNATIFNPMSSSFKIDNYHTIHRDRYSLFSEWNAPIIPDWQAQIGIRYSRVHMKAGTVDAQGLPAMLQMNVNTLKNAFNTADRTQQDNLLDIAATLNHTLTPELDLTMGLARKERAPSYQARYLWLPLESTSGLADGNNYVGNINLKKETAYQAELGFDWHSRTFAITPHLFYHRINNYIQGTLYNTNMAVNMINTMMQTGPQPATVLQFNNVDARLYGMDTNWMWAMAPHWQLEGMISYVRGKRRDVNDNLYRIAPLTARTALNFIQPKWRIAFEAETVAAQHNVSIENNEQRTAGYTLFHLRGQYQPNDTFRLSAGINNLFDRFYRDHLAGYSRISSVDGSAVGQGERLPGLGRSAYVNLQLKW